MMRFLSDTPIDSAVLCFLLADEDDVSPPNVGSDAFLMDGVLIIFIFYPVL